VETTESLRLWGVSMAFLDDYVRVDADNPCPKCGRSDWCAIHVSGRKCVCAREPSGKPAGDAGWIHYISGTAPPKPVESNKMYLTPGEIRDHMRPYYHPSNHSLIALQAETLGLSFESLQAFYVGYEQDSAALVFPMFDAERLPTGCRYRRRDGKKWSLKGGREGVFRTRAFNPSKPVFIAEGPTDAAALVEAGFDNILGRPNCTGGTSIIYAILKDHPKTPVVILADPDDPGVDGAIRLVRKLPNPCIALAGPADIREFVTEISTPADARESILSLLIGYSRCGWDVVARNRAASCFDFASLNPKVLT
jgi:5S rRNA maturation endonuclease (ribonuclease M5)